ncbi:hypothetical protein EVAR_40216_1 [Eumeta japonica]|uniref:Uncharacterized protein n=1 Tax=Eumeta variegata TaxID=151549 RepID=A0A4C1XA95_EUMVA|nr:hypothetical protein EVAR_40216_1 [Eumeta japonica]
MELIKKTKNSTGTRAEVRAKASDFIKYSTIALIETGKIRYGAYRITRCAHALSQSDLCGFRGNWRGSWTSDPACPKYDPAIVNGTVGSLYLDL